ncbi:MAG: protease modulator HflC [Catonella sp.]|uniref:protease modulator HflC n=1 Tax=Catonella sp. TaxID=2382125 RepID=UPI003F9EC9CF
MKKTKKLFLILLILAGFLGFSSTYSLRENEYGIRLQFNKIVAVDNNAGLYFKLPFIQNIRKVPKSIQLYDIRPSDVMTADKKSMIADMYILWRIVDPTVYYQTLNANVNNAKDRTGITVYNSVKSVISSMTQDEIIEARGEKLTQTITADANPDIKKYGIEIVQAQLKSLDLPDDNKQAVYDRMISERNNIAASYTAEGESKAKKIQNETDKQVAILKAQAEKNSAKLKAEGEAKYMETLQQAYNDKDKAEFYNYIRSLDALKVSLSGQGEKKLMLGKDSELAKILYGNFE